MRSGGVCSIGLLVLLVACTGSETDDPTSTSSLEAVTSTNQDPTFTSSRDVVNEIDQVLAPPPADCDVYAITREEVSPRYAPLLGSAPVWFGPYLSVDEAEGVFRLHPGARVTRDGWQVKFLFVVQGAATGQVTVSGADTHGRPLRFAIDAQEPPTRSGVMNVASARETFVDFPSYVYFPGAGCFTLKAQWPGGSWQLSFAVGSAA